MSKFSKTMVKMSKKGEITKEDLMDVDSSCKERIVEFAMKQGDLTTIQNLKDLGLDVSPCLNIQNWISAISKRDLPMVEFIISSGMDLPIPDNCGINLAISLGYLEIVEKIIEAGVDVKNGAFLEKACVSFNNLQTVRFLLSHGSEITTEAIKNSISFGNLIIVKELVSRLTKKNLHKVLTDDLLEFILTNPHVSSEIKEYLLEFY